MSDSTNTHPMFAFYGNQLLMDYEPGELTREELLSFPEGTIVGPYILPGGVEWWTIRGDGCITYEELPKPIKAMLLIFRC